MPPDVRFPRSILFYPIDRDSGELPMRRPTFALLTTILPGTPSHKSPVSRRTVVSMAPDGRWQGAPQIHLEAAKTATPSRSMCVS
jgi:hypothetical protein